MLSFFIYIRQYATIVSVFKANIKQTIQTTFAPFRLDVFGLSFPKKVLKFTKSCKNTIYLQEMFVISSMSSTFEFTI
jgi:hypothetical protein